MLTETERIFKKTKQNKKKRSSSEEDCQVTETTQHADIQPPCLCQAEELLGKLLAPRIGCQPFTHLLDQAAREIFPVLFPTVSLPSIAKLINAVKVNLISLQFAAGLFPCYTAHKSSGHLSAVFFKDTERLKCSLILHFSFSEATIFSILYILYCISLLH